MPLDLCCLHRLKMQQIWKEVEVDLLLIRAYHLRIQVVHLNNRAFIPELSHSLILEDMRGRIPFRQRRLSLKCRRTARGLDT